jgi:hypothetical protein
MSNQNDTTTPELSERPAESALSASPGSAGIEPRDYEVYKETGVSWEGGKAHHFLSLACRCSTLENAKKAARIIFDESDQLYLVRIVEVTRIGLAHYSPNSKISGCEPTDKAQH